MNTLRYDPAGSLWRKWDLHFHTPSSYDYQDKSLTDADIIAGLKTAGVSVVAITDHHLIDVQRISRLQSLGHAQGITVLPGIELRSELGGSETVHFIGIFPEDCDLNDVWTRLSGKLDLTTAAIAARGGDERVYIDFKDGAKKIRALGGIVTAHAGSKSNSVESIKNNVAYKRALKADLVEFIDILEVGKVDDCDDYRTIVFPAIKRQLPLILCSDNHKITKYEPKAACWIKGDPSFRTFQQIKSDPHRVYLGDEPPEVVRVRNNPTKYIESIEFQKDPASSLSEIWFNGSVPINSGLVAIIGNKGSGKTALAEAIGLLGNCEVSEYFSFLNGHKFRQNKNNKARHFTATMKWRNNHRPSMSLADTTNATKPRDVLYIPQSYLEKICNEVLGQPDSKFDAELKSVIFSHVADKDRLDSETLDELLDFKLFPIDERIGTLQSELSAINARIIELEERSGPTHHSLLANLKESKERELAAHEASKPTEVVQPESDPRQKAEMARISEEIRKESISRDVLQGHVRTSEAANKKSTAQIATAARVDHLLQNFQASHTALLKTLAPDCLILGLDPKALVSVNVDLESIATVSAAAEQAVKEESEKIRAANTSIVAATSKMAELAALLDAPNSAHQRYLQALHLWTERRAEIIGDADHRDSLRYIEAQIAELEKLPAVLETEKASRLNKTKEVFAEIHATVSIYRKLYEPVQVFIDKHQVAKSPFQMEFDASIVASRWEDALLAMINQGRKGSFNGVEDGKIAMTTLIEKADFGSADGAAAFCEALLDMLRFDHRATPPTPNVVADQLRSSATLNSFLDAVFGLSYLEPKYQLKWAGKTIEELSPGERGTLLLIFYLLIDRRDIPLVIDQPEDNLDNQTVYDMLVECLRAARNRRQVIIVTHNPNLAVVCDADQVIHSHIDKQDNRNEVTYTSGSIENPAINALSIKVLEGTRPAFDHRDSKYHLDKVAAGISNG